MLGSHVCAISSGFTLAPLLDLKNRNVQVERMKSGTEGQQYWESRRQHRQSCSTTTLASSSDTVSKIMWPRQTPVVRCNSKMPLLKKLHTDQRRIFWESLWYNIFVSIWSNIILTHYALVTYTKILINVEYFCTIYKITSDKTINLKDSKEKDPWEEWEGKKGRGK